MIIQVVQRQTLKEWQVNRKVTIEQELAYLRRLRREALRREALAEGLCKGLCRALGAPRT